MAVPNDDYLIRLHDDDLAPGNELIRWNNPASLQPDDREIVLLRTAGLVYPGYLDVDEWRWPVGGIVEQDVIEWAAMPKGSRKAGQ
ncbi:MAG: hypothetical protein U0930_03740 [Pirellulales bacterium]